jgi:hypothetical protein
MQAWGWSGYPVRIQPLFVIFLKPMRKDVYHPGVNKEKSEEERQQENWASQNDTDYQQERFYAAHTASIIRNQPPPRRQLFHCFGSAYYKKQSP